MRPSLKPVDNQGERLEGESQVNITQEVVSFAVRTRFEEIASEALYTMKRHILDSLGVALAGTAEEAFGLLCDWLKAKGGPVESQVWGTKYRAPVDAAALANGLAGHVLDYDDTQLATTPEGVYGLLTHPSVPVLAAALPVAEQRGLSGRDLLAAFYVGSEVECRLADAMAPRHYREGFHSSGTIGTIGAAVAAGRLLGLAPEGLGQALGIAASMAAGLRENFGTMTKALHVGRAAANGVLAAQLAAAGYTAATNILEAPRGFFQAMGGGFAPDRITGRLGRPYFYLEPGVSIKPHPCGSLAHPAMAAMQRLMQQPFSLDQVESIAVGTASNIPNALIHTQPQTALEAKFSMQFCLAILLLEGRAGIQEFRDDVVRRPDVQDLMRRIHLYVHPEAEALGYDRMTSIIDVTLKDGRRLTDRSDIARGHPENPMSDAEVVAKFQECAAVALSREQAEQIVETVWRLEKVADVCGLTKLLAAGQAQ